MLKPLALAVILTVAAATAQAAALPYDRSLGTNLFYKVPDGFRAARQPSGVAMTKADGTPGFLLVAEEIPLTADLQRQPGATLAQALVIQLGGFTNDASAKISTPEQRSARARDGYDLWKVVSRNLDPATRQTRDCLYAVVFVNRQAQLFVACGFGGGALDRLTPGFNELLASASFRSLGATPPPKGAPPLPTDLAALAPKAPTPAAAPAAAKSGRQCRTVQRQACSGGIGTSLGYFCNTYPQRVCD